MAIGYTVDVAYFVDTLMTIEQLTQFIDRHPNIPEKTNSLTHWDFVSCVQVAGTRHERHLPKFMPSGSRREHLLDRLHKLN